MLRLQFPSARSSHSAFSSSGSALWACAWRAAADGPMVMLACCDVVQRARSYSTLCGAQQAAVCAVRRHTRAQQCCAEEGGSPSKRKFLIWTPFSVAFPPLANTKGSYRQKCNHRCASSARPKEMRMSKHRPQGQHSRNNEVCARPDRTREPRYASASHGHRHSTQPRTPLTLSRVASHNTTHTRDESAVTAAQHVSVRALLAERNPGTGVEVRTCSLLKAHMVVPAPLFLSDARGRAHSSS